MKKTLSLSLALAFASAVSVFAADAPAGAPAAPAAAPAEGRKPAKVQMLPFRGKLAAVDKQAKTITVGERVFQITAQTRLIKAAKPCALDDVVVGEDVAGAYKAVEGKLEAVTVRFGARPEPAPKAAPAKKPAAK